MTRRYRRHSEEFKRQAVNMILRDRTPLTEVARSLDINTTSLENWVRNHKDKEASDEAKLEEKSSKKTDKERIRHLEAKIKKLEMEKEILKKAAAFFAKDSM